MACHNRISRADDKAWKQFETDHRRNMKLSEQKKKPRNIKMTPEKMAALNNLLGGKL